MPPLRLPSATPLRGFVAAAFAGAPFLTSGLASGQDFSLRVSDGNRALTQTFFPSPALANLKGGFDFGVGALLTYDSNFFLSEDYTVSELTADVNPWITYRTDPEGGAEFSFEGRYAPSFLAYLNNEDLNGINHSGGVLFKYAATRTTIQVYADYDEVSMADRLVGGFIEGSILGYGISGSYQLGPRTALLAGWSASQSDYSSGARSGSDIYTSEVAGLWDATERLRIGPSITYTMTESDSTGERDAVALLVKTRYQFGERILLDAAGGLEYSKNSRSNEGWEPGFTGRLAADYMLSHLWTFRAGVRYSTVPSPNNLNYLVNDLSFTSAIVRNFERSSLELGVGVSFSDYEAVGVVVGNREDDEFMNAYLTYRRNLYSDRVNFESTVKCATNTGQKDWSQWQITTGISVDY
ncbi:outer membrane protein transport protein [Luteolibacter arcticus]|uniref:Outer membrane protein transport protein n=1 Tax=Luteolibacter arcticus TaxID=1581411 RepID=A0ABT3GGZ0_9BACT|nr:outer membrane protein transport protein [Luteolibacter arcticus]MCW1922886.1 outer membrane protein transport protein [Luteolibacter arcticus]